MSEDENLRVVLEAPRPKPKPQPTPNDYLAAIERHMRNTEQHLKSIRSMMTFFVVMLILAVVIQACTALMAF